MYTFLSSYAELVDIYLEEEELRYFLPLKEYQSYCEALRLIVCVCACVTMCVCVCVCVCVFNAGFLVPCY